MPGGSAEKALAEIREQSKGASEEDLHVALRRGDEAAAQQHLLASGGVLGSPALNSFGPNMSLARALLLRVRGRTRVVLEYLDKCSEFWGKLPQWRADVEAGKMPDFGANLKYGLPDEIDELV